MPQEVIASRFDRAELMVSMLPSNKQKSKLQLHDEKRTCRPDKEG